MLILLTICIKLANSGLHCTMAPMKRSSAQANHDAGEEYEIVDVESSRSSLRQDSVGLPMLLLKPVLKICRGRSPASLMKMQMTLLLKKRATKMKSNKQLSNMPLSSGKSSTWTMCLPTMGYLRVSLALTSCAMRTWRSLCAHSSTS